MRISLFPLVVMNFVAPISVAQESSFPGLYERAIELCIEYNLPNSMARPQGFDLSAHLVEVNQERKSIAKKFSNKLGRAYLKQRIPSETDSVNISCAKQLLLEAQPDAKKHLTRRSTRPLVCHVDNRNFARGALTEALGLPMNSQRMATFVRRWFAEWEAEQWGRASQILNYLIRFRPDEAWTRILALISVAEEESLGYVGAGPLEDLLSAKGIQVIPWLEAEAKFNARLVKCVGAVWGDLRFEPEILQRVRNISPVTSY